MAVGADRTKGGVIVKMTPVTFGIIPPAAGSSPSHRGFILMAPHIAAGPGCRIKGCHKKVNIGRIAAPFRYVCVIVYCIKDHVNRSVEMPTLVVESNSGSTSPHT